jgi:WD40 repeat protein
VWTQEGECLQTLTGHCDAICALAVTRDGLIVTGSCDRTAKVWAVGSESL